MQLTAQALSPVKHIKVTNAIEYVRRCTLNMTNLNAVHRRKGGFRLYHIVQDDVATTVTTKWNLGFTQTILINALNAWHDHGYNTLTSLYIWSENSRAKSKIKDGGN